MSLKDEIDGHTVLAGLLAHPAGHSMSPAMYNAAFPCGSPFDIV